MQIISEIQQYAQSISAEIAEKKGLYTLKVTVAERKTFLSKQKLSYEAKFRIDEANKTIKFTEALREDASGMQAGGGFQVETYSTGKSGAREGSIQQQSDQFGKKYSYSFDFKTVRETIESIAQKSGYSFVYQITSLGL